MSPATLKVLPKELRPAGKQVEAWVEENPGTTLAIGATLGVVLGLVGIRRVIAGAKLLQRMPLATSLLSTVALGVFEGHESKFSSKANSKTKSKH